MRWEPKHGNLYCVVFSKLLEIFSVDDDSPLHSVSFDTEQTSCDFISESSVIVSDCKGRLTLFTDVNDPEKMQMRIIQTDSNRIKQVKSSPDQKFFTTLSANSLEVWDSEILINASKPAEGKDADLMCSLSAQAEFSYTQRLINCEVNLITK